MATVENYKQSRVGKVPVEIPGGVTVTIKGSEVTCKGPKGEMFHKFHETVEIKMDDGKVVVTPRKGSGKRGTQFQGLTRSLIHNSVQGVHQGYKTSLDLYGVGYRAEVKGQKITMALGLSHQVKYEMPVGVSAKVETIDEAGLKRPRLHLESHDKALLGRVAARIKSFRPPEPYKGKGIRFTGERIRQKAGKTGAK